MSNLSDLISSYSPEQYYRLNYTYGGSGTITNLGSGGSTVWFTTGTPVLNPSGGPDGEGSWQFAANAATETSFRRFNTTVFTDNEIGDADYSWGIWAMVPPPPATGTFDSSYLIGQASGETATQHFYLNLNTGYIAPTVGGIAFSLSQFGDLRDGNWHFYSGLSRFNGTNYDVQLFVDGVLALAETRDDINKQHYVQIGDSGVSGDDYGIVEYAYYLIAPTASMAETEFLAIYDTGTSVPGVDVQLSPLPFTLSSLSVDPTLKTSFNFETLPMTANANLPLPTFIAVIADSVYITTTIIISAEFLPNYNVTASQNINITPADPMFADAESVNNVIVATGSDELVAVAEFVATAEIVEPFRPVSYFEASAIFVNPLVQVETNYSSLITSANPYLYIGDGSSTPTNLGYQSGTITLVGIDAAQPATDQLALVNEGLAWGYDNVGEYIEFAPPSVETSWGSIVGQTFNFSMEMWVKTQTNVQKILFEGGDENADKSPVSRIILNTNGSVQAFVTRNSASVGSVSSAAASFLSGNWNHIAVTGKNNNDGTATFQIWINGQLSGTYTTSVITYTNTTIQELSFGDRVRITSGNAGSVLVDEIAIYTQTLTNSEIVQRHDFVVDLSPDATIAIVPFTATAQSGNHIFSSSASINFQTIFASSNSVLVDPTIFAETNIQTASVILTANALMVNPVFVGTPDFNQSESAYTVYAEMGSAVVINNQYANHVLNNLNPYRYVTFDTANSFEDLGSDTDYAVPSVSFNGTIVGPETSINNKSALTSGLDYTSSGVVLMESEFDDDWGTGADEDHSSFWMQRSLNDNSINGLRVLWNLNGAFDNQHVILYQWQGDLWLQFNNGSGTHLEQAAIDYDLFDYDRHHVVINFDHTGINNFVNLYVDGSLAMTVDIGTYTGSTINSDVPLAPNDPANNYPRLAIGSLITPFEVTVLPVVPANYSSIFDEIHWSKQGISAAAVATLYSTMPPKVSNILLADPMTSAAELTEATASGESKVVAEVLSASSELIEPQILVGISKTIIHSSFFVYTFMQDAEFAQIVDVQADVMILGAYMMGPFLQISAKADPMELTGFMSLRFVNDIDITREISPWAKHLRATDAVVLSRPTGVK